MCGLELLIFSAIDDSNEPLESPDHRVLPDAPRGQAAYTIGLTRFANDHGLYSC